jgi:hypothetical protein
MTDLRFFTTSDLYSLVALTFELAAQLHEERSQRIALEGRLEEAGVLSARDLEAPPAPAAQDRTRAALETSMSGIIRVLAESGPPEHPIRDEAREDAWAVRHG